jgi:hypothetical protein
MDSLSWRLVIIRTLFFASAIFALVGWLIDSSFYKVSAFLLFFFVLPTVISYYLEAEPNQPRSRRPPPMRPTGGLGFPAFFFLRDYLRRLEQVEEEMKERDKSQPSELPVIPEIDTTSASGSASGSASEDPQGV